MAGGAKSSRSRFGQASQIVESSDQPGTFITARTYSVILDLDTHSEGYPSFIDLLFLLLLLLAVSNLLVLSHTSKNWCKRILSRLDTPR